jgi:hypothetical protein
MEHSDCITNQVLHSHSSTCLTVFVVLMLVTTGFFSPVRVQAQGQPDVVWSSNTGTNSDEREAY